MIARGCLCATPFPRLTQRRGKDDPDTATSEQQVGFEDRFVADKVE